MKKLSILSCIVFLIFLFANCRSNAFTQNTGLSNKKPSTIATVKGGKKTFCRH